MIKIATAVGTHARIFRCIASHYCRWNTKVLPVKRLSSTFSNKIINDCSCNDIFSIRLPVRYYAKSKDRQSNKGKKKVSVDENLLAEHIKYNVMKSEMEKCVVSLKNNYIKNLSLRSSMGSIESLPVTFEGDEYVIQDLAQIVRKNPKTLIINMTTFPLAIPAVLDSLKASGMNLNPQQDKTSIFIPIPKVTKEHRENLIKNAKSLFVKCKDNIKDSQNKYIKLLKDNDTLSTDLVHTLQDQITALADKYVLEAQRIMEEKQNELKGDS